MLTENSPGLNSLNYYIAPKVYSYGLKLMGCNYSSKKKGKQRSDDGLIRSLVISSIVT